MDFLYKYFPEGEELIIMTKKDLDRQWSEKLKEIDKLKYWNQTLIAAVIGLLGIVMILIGVII